MGYKVIGMMKVSGLDKDLKSGVAVPYMSASERASYLVTVQSGRIMWKTGRFDTNSKPFLYVMDGDGNIYTGSPIEVHHHSAFLAGQPAAAAGLWGVTDGKLVWINGESGHYMPPGDYSEQILTELKKRGVKLKDVEKDFFIDSKKCAIGRKKRAGIKGLKWWQKEKGAVKVTDHVEGLKDAEGNPVESGSHIKGQVLRLYPGKKPEWSWF